MKGFWTIILLLLFFYGQQAAAQPVKNSEIYERCLVNVSKRDFDLNFQTIDLYCQLYTHVQSAEYAKADSMLPVMDSILVNTSDSDFVAFAMLKVATVHGLRERFIPAFTRYQSALKYYMRKDDHEMIVDVLVRIAEHYRSIASFDLAKHHLELAEMRIKDYGEASPKTMARYWHRKAALAVEDGEDVEAAIAHSNKALSYSEPANELEEMATSYLELGYMYYQQRDERSIGYFNEALKIWRRLGLVHYEANTMNNISRLYCQNGRYELCESMLKDLLKLCEKHDLKTVSYDAYRRMADVHVEKGQHDSALLLERRAIEIERKRLIDQFDFAVVELSQKYGTELTTKEMERIASEKEKAVEEAEAQGTTNLQLIVGLGASILLMLALYLMYNRLQAKNRAIEQQQLQIRAKNDELSASLKDKETLLQEVHHRVKNNLQFIMALMEMQLGDEGEANEALLENISRRILAISLVHEQLYAQDEMESVLISSYISDLCEMLDQFVNIHKIPVRFEIDADPIKLDITRSISIGMIIAELVTNSIKHAFNGVESPIIEITLKAGDGHKACHLRVADNGMGVESIDSNGLGMRLVSMFSRQLKAETKKSTKNGVAFEFRFNL